jgi:hypothetical protein
MLKRNTAAVLAFISVQDFDLAVGCLSAFWMVQRCIVKDKGVGGFDDGVLRTVSGI